MIKCDFCTEYNPKTKECWWQTQCLKTPYCERAIDLMVKAMIGSNQVKKDK